MRKYFGYIHSKYYFNTGNTTQPKLIKQMISVSRIIVGPRITLRVNL